MQPWQFLAEMNPLEHVVQHAMVRKQVGEGVTLTLLSNHILIQILAALILIVVLVPMFRWKRGSASPTSRPISCRATSATSLRRCASSSGRAWPSHNSVTRPTA